MAETKTGNNLESGAFGHRIAVLGLGLFAVFAPHSIAGAEIAAAIATAGWLIRFATSHRGRNLTGPASSPGRPGLRHTKLDLPIFLFIGWTVASAFLSAEPRVSLAKLQSISVFFLFYLTQAIATRRTAVVFVSIMIVSGVAGTFASVYDLIRGRGVVVQSIARDSPFLRVHPDPPAPGPGGPTIQPGDTIWRVGGRRVYSVSDIDQVIRGAAPHDQLSVGLITHGEQVEWVGLEVTETVKAKMSPAGLTGSGRLHRFRASGWTRHYEYFAEILQILAQLSLGLALANFQNHRTNLRFKLALIAAGILALGIALTAMRTVMVAFAIGGCVIVWNAAKGASAKFLVTAAIAFVLGFGAVVVWETRATNALFLQDDSAAVRLSVARAALSRILVHPLFGQGMDAVKEHWVEWGFPPAVRVHLHSTPLQIAFDRGLPALVFWLWIMVAFWLIARRAEKATRDSGDTNRHGVLLGATGALAGFFASSLVNYNFGAAIVALVFWWLMGIVVVLARQEESFPSP